MDDYALIQVDYTWVIHIRHNEWVSSVVKLFLETGDYLQHIYTLWLVVYQEDTDNTILEFRADLRLAYDLY